MRMNTVILLGLAVAVSSAFAQPPFAVIDKATGDVLGVAGMPGDGLGEFGEAHLLAVGDDESVYVADVVNRRVQKYRSR